ncbi:hypothetical protein [Coleofasciculus sp. FACHB-1120]|uniref:hypothetical protein n=1 Tax=Coleofasciculus sp. FACHB-1120 TaxID=2692783 RepID=UPI001686BE6E|nr:hypothetical protein [Coleofasciculus sp. FACHB-1120]
MMALLPTLKLGSEIKGYKLLTLFSSFKFRMLVNSIASLNHPIARGSPSSANAAYQSRSASILFFSKGFLSIRD